MSEAFSTENLQKDERTLEEDSEESKSEDMGEERWPEEKLLEEERSVPLEDHYDSDVLEADVLYAGEVDTPLRRNLIDELEKRGYNVEIVGRSEISDGEVRNVPARYLDGKEMVLRRKRGFRSPVPENDMELVEDLRSISPNVNIRPGPEGAFASDDKLFTKNLLNASGVSTTQTYRSEREVENALLTGRRVVSKPRDSSHGRGFEIIEPDDEFSFDEERVYEEMIDHWSDDSPWEERRALVASFSDVNMIGEVKARDKRSDRKEPKNYNNGGFYRDLDPEENPLMRNEMEQIWKTAEAMEGGILGIDYLVNTDTGEYKAIEVNSTVQTEGIAGASEMNVYESLADALESQMEGYELGRVHSDHLSEVIGYSTREELMADSFGVEMEDLEYEREFTAAQRRCISESGQIEQQADTKPQEAENPA